jgi:diguanylate cyclase (GGDEF)-like protein
MSIILKEITYKALKQIKNRDVVLPEDYSKIFEKCAKELNFDLSNKELVLQDLNHDVNKLDNIVKNTNKNLETLQTSTKNAQEAIISKDTAQLGKITEDLESMKKEIHELQQELFTDTLTKAHNRKWFNNVYLHNQKFQLDGFLIFIDLNDFKQINDTYGHIIGDMVLKYLSNFLKKEVSFKSKHVVRYAGDEFILLIDDKVSYDTVLHELNEIQEKLTKQKLKIKSSNNITFNFGFSYGLVAYKKNEQSERVIELADEKMYQNKLKVKNKL